MTTVAHALHKYKQQINKINLFFVWTFEIITSETPAFGLLAPWRRCLKAVLRRMHGRPQGHTRQWLCSIDANIDKSVSSPSALGFVFVGAHELHSINRNVLLFDGLLHTPLVLPESLGARVATAVPLQELLGEPAVKALVVLPLQVRAGLSNAVHIRLRPWKTTR